PSTRQFGEPKCRTRKKPSSSPARRTASGPRSSSLRACDGQLFDADRRKSDAYRYRLTVLAAGSDPAIELQVVADAFKTIGVEFYIGGSIASAYHGEPRSTVDVDLIADLPTSDASRLVHLLGEDFYADSSMMIQAITSRTSFNLIHLPTMYKIDVFIPKLRPFDKSVRQRVIQAAAFEGDDRIYQIASIEDTDEALWDTTLDTNVKSAFFCSRAALPALRQSRGVIINHSSIAGLMGFANIAAYCTAKAALAG
ncbi:MAG: SDR family NAD(P)-dependent oxidoreductase, partial [Chloroflexi bacterium]|nr:SDR family NAD(P)-dependent oxidoreductase [Chloroflexota bacterium]